MAARALILNKIIALLLSSVPVPIVSRFNFSNLFYPIRTIGYAYCLLLCFFVTVY